MPGVTATPPRAKTELAELWRLDAGDYVTSVNISSDGRLCALGNGAGQLVVADLASGAACWSAPAHPDGVLQVAFASDGRLVATCGHDGSARIYSASGAFVCALPGVGSWVEHVAWAPDSQSIAIASGRAVRVFTRTGESVLETPALPSTVTAIGWNRTGRELAATGYGGVHVWTVAEAGSARKLAFKGSLISMAWSPDGKVIACASQDSSVHFWRLNTGQDAAMSGYRFKTRALAWDSHSRLLATAGDAAITVWDFGGAGPEGTRPMELEGHNGLCTRLSFSPRKGVLASGSQDTSVLLWEPNRGSKPIRFGFLEDEVTAVVWHPRHEGIIGADASGNVIFWKVA
ncbi:MAG: hypothetical protein RLZZ450_5771 [Pseudomonadota bacterium]|jgi:WD40 repeat protein